MLEIEDVTKSYDGVTKALSGVRLTLTRGEIVCLVGPSGCGKTTLLRVVAGLEQADSGQVLLDGVDLSTQPVHARGFGLMFQEFALFPDKSVAQNVAFGLRMAGTASDETRARVEEMLALVNLAGYGDRSIFQLSGGERQRVALARSLAPRPRLLMLDEPLGSLDRALRESLMDELRAILKRLGLTALYVTHDQQEALAVADRVVVMNRGVFAQVGAPREIYLAPVSAFVARFLGFQNLLTAEVRAVDAGCALTAIGAVPLVGVADTGQYTLLIRPEAIVLGEGQMWRGSVVEASFRGTHVRAEVAVLGAAGAIVLTFVVPVESALVAGQEIVFGLDPALCSLLPGE